MAPTHFRQLLVWSVPTAVALFTFLWYRHSKRAQADADRDPTSANATRSAGTLEPASTCRHVVADRHSSLPLTRSAPSTPVAAAGSGIAMSCSEPIDIRPSRSMPIVLSDTELDIEIEKMRSMKNGSGGSSGGSSGGGGGGASISATTIGSGNGGRVVAGPSVATDTDAVQPRANSSERDSANHSPADAMLVSPSHSSVSDNRSEEGSSSDSGKGGSDVATPPPPTIPLATAAAESAGHVHGAPPPPAPSVVHDFLISQQLVGRLIGRHGASVQQIKIRTGAHVVIKKHPDSNTLKVCTVEGSETQVRAALSMIRDKFPTKRFPDLTLKRVSVCAPVPLVPQSMHLKLVEGINNDTVVSCMVAPNHLFLQQPTHPSYPSLNVLTHCMSACYSNAAGSPLLPEPIAQNTVCAAFFSGLWYRVTVVSVHTNPQHHQKRQRNEEEAGNERTDAWMNDVEEEEQEQEQETMVCIKFLDLGGYAQLPASMLRQIRCDFLLLPFQAAECVLADVEPVDGPNAPWSPEAYHLMTRLTEGAVLCTQVMDYLEDEEQLPLVRVYVRDPSGRFILLNNELVRQGYARSHSRATVGSDLVDPTLLS